MQLCGSRLNVNSFKPVSQASPSEKLWGRKPKTQDAAPRQCAVRLHCGKQKHLYLCELVSLVGAAMTGEAKRI